MTELERARKLAKTPALVAALDANQAFITWVGWMRDSPAPLGQAEAIQKEWAKKAATMAKSVEKNPPLAALVSGLATWPKPAAPIKGTPMSCPKVSATAAASSTGWARMPTVPGRPKEVVGGCPCGWLDLHLLDDDLSRSDPYDGVRTCVPAGWSTGLRWVDLRLPLGSVDKVALLVEGGDALSGTLGSLERWQSQCKSLVIEGVSDKGLTAYLGECPILNADRVVLMADGCRVVSALLLRDP